MQMPGLGEFCSYCIKNHTCESRVNDWMSQIYSKFKDDFQAVVLLSSFVGHPVSKLDQSLIGLLS